MGGHARGSTRLSMQKDVLMSKESYESAKKEALKQLWITRDFEIEYHEAWEKYETIFKSLNINIYERYPSYSLFGITIYTKHLLGSHTLSDHLHVYRNDRHLDEISMHFGQDFKLKAEIAKFLLKLPQEKFHEFIVALLHVQEAKQAFDNQREYIYALRFFRERAQQFTTEKETKIYDPAFFERVFDDGLYEAAGK